MQYKIVERIAAEAGLPLLQPSKIDARVLNSFDRKAFEVTQDFEAIEPAPVCGLGLNRVLGGIGTEFVCLRYRSAGYGAG